MNRLAIDTKQIWADVQDNSRRTRECPRHAFTADLVKLGERLTCKNCGGTLRLTDIGQYIAGYVAAGGNAADIWPAYARDMAKATQPAASRGEATPNPTAELGA